MSDLNRREALKAGAFGTVFAFLFRGRRGDLSIAPIEPAQPPAAAVVTCRPQTAFRPERLVIHGVKIGTEMVPAMRWEPCEACERRWAERGDDDDTYCEACDDAGGASVPTGELVERAVMRAPWIIDDISINRREQLAGEVPGDLFAVDALDAFVTLDATQAASEIRFRVRYTGDKPDGDHFIAALIGRGEHGQRLVMPIRSGRKIAA